VPPTDFSGSALVFDFGAIRGVRKEMTPEVDCEYSYKKVLRSKVVLVLTDESDSIQTIQTMSFIKLETIVHLLKTKQQYLSHKFS
jgi:hypothetical protein